MTGVRTPASLTYMNTETLTGTLTRPVTMVATDHRTKLVTDSRQVAAGTEVYVTETRRGTFSIRIPGTLFTQEVYPATVESA